MEELGGFTGGRDAFRVFIFLLHVAFTCMSESWTFTAFDIHNICTCGFLDGAFLCLPM